MSEIGYMSASELARLVGCKPNQRSAMIKWLTTNRWTFEVDRHGLPKVAQAYHDRKMGIIEDRKQAKYAEGPNLQAFVAH